MPVIAPFLSGAWVNDGSPGGENRCHYSPVRRKFIQRIFRFKKYQRNNQKCGERKTTSLGTSDRRRAGFFKVPGEAF